MLYLSAGDYNDAENDVTEEDGFNFDEEVCIASSMMIITVSLCLWDIIVTLITRMTLKMLLNYGLIQILRTKLYKLISLMMMIQRKIDCYSSM